MYVDVAVHMLKMAEKNLGFIYPHLLQLSELQQFCSYCLKYEFYVSYCITLHIQFLV